MCEGVGEAKHLKIWRDSGGLDRVANRNLGRRILAWSTIGFWLVMIGLLIQRENFTSPFTPYVELSPSLGLEPGETIDAEDAWMGVYFQGNKVGWLHHTCRPEDGGYVVREESLTHLKMMDIPQKISVTTTCRTDNSFALTSFDFRMRSDVVSMVVLGEVEGKGAASSPAASSFPQPATLPGQRRVGGRQVLSGPGGPAFDLEPGRCSAHRGRGGGNTDRRRDPGGLPYSGELRRNGGDLLV
jgi:hypothetical protein